ncbi:MAG: alginate export family protein [Planctomycetota bacterium]|jgi:hypothetical protein
MRVFVGALLVLLILGVGAALADEETEEPAPEGVGEEPVDEEAEEPPSEDVDEEVVKEPPEDVSRDEFEALLERVAELEAEDRRVRVFSAAAEQVTLFGQVRSRFEYQKNFDLNHKASDTKDFFLLRTRLGADVDIVDHLSARVKFQDSRFFGVEGGVTMEDVPGVDLKEGYFDLDRAFGSPVDVRVGRAEMKYGDQRLISTLDWHPVGRSWDGLWLSFEQDTLSTDLFFTRIDDDFLGPNRSESEDFIGLYNTIRTEQGEADIYILFRRNQEETDVVAEDGDPGHEQLWTFGSRFAAEVDGISAGGELAVQHGDYAGDNILAHMVEVWAGFTGPGDRSPHGDVTFIWATGDSDPKDGKRNTFDPLYTFGHYYLGLMDRVGRRNIISPRLRLSMKPCDGWTVFLDGHAFWLETSEDALYHAGGVLRTPIGGSNRYVGSEVDLHAKGKILKRLAVWVGYSRFFTGRGTRDTGGGNDADYFFLQLTLGF